jgi:hypothetical protein
MFPKMFYTDRQVEDNMHTYLEIVAVNAIKGSFRESRAHTLGKRDKKPKPASKAEHAISVSKF